MLQLHFFKGFQADSKVLDTCLCFTVLLDIAYQNGTGNVCRITKLVGVAAKTVQPAVGIKKMCDLLSCDRTLPPTPNIIFRGAEMPIGYKWSLEKDDQR